MAHSASACKALIQTSLLAVGCKGSESEKLARASANAYVKFMTTIVKVISVDSGLLSVGKGTGKILGPLPALYLATCTALAPAKGIKGIFGPLTAGAVGLGCGLHTLAAGTTETNHPVVGPGVGIGTLTGATPGAFFPILISEFASAGLAGPLVPNFCQAISQGIAPNVVAAIVPIVIIGPGSISPGAGPGLGSVL